MCCGQRNIDGSREGSKVVACHNLRWPRLTILDPPRKPSRGKHAWTILEEEYLAELYEQETFIYYTGCEDFQKTEKKNNKH